MLPDELRINEFDITQIQSKMTLYLGSSQSGKSQLILDNLFKLRDQIPNIIVICPTESQNGTYSGIVPPECIVEQNLSSEKLLIKLSDIYQRQMKVTQIYNDANNLHYLKELARKLQIEDDNRILELQEVLIELKKNQQSLNGKEEELANYSELMIQLKNDIQRAQFKIIQKYKKLINEAVKDPDLQDNLNAKELDVANSIYINPKLILVLDDIAASLDTQVQKSEIVKKIFFQGRHSNLTCFIAVQNDKKLIPELRQQAHYVFFTDPVCLDGYQKSGGFSTKQVKEHGDIMRIYKDQYVKVLFNRCNSEFHYVKAFQRSQFTFGSNAFINFCQYVSNSKEN